MQLKIDKNKPYAIALEGGGAKGAYQIGVWRALREAGIKYNAVSGTSVGALNGAMMVMGDYRAAVNIWKNIRLSDVVELEAEEEKELKKILKGEAAFSDVQGIVPQALDIIRNRGLDVAPLHAWVRKLVDEKAIKESGIDFFVTTLSLTDRKGLEVKVNDLPAEQIGDMLLASAYHPSFKLEKLGGKLYTDGGLVDSLPIHPLVANGYKDIIAVRLPGMGVEKRFKLPEDVNIITIETNSDLGHILNFDAEQSKLNMHIGYLDAKRVLYGLYGKKYYIDRSMSEKDALDWLIKDCAARKCESNIRRICERELPKLSLRLMVLDGDYYDLLIALAEERARKMEIDHMRVYTDRALLRLIK